MTIKTRPIKSWDEVPVVFDLPILSRLLGRTPEGLIKKAQKKEIPAFKIGVEWRFEKAAIQEFIKNGGNL